MAMEWGRASSSVTRANKLGTAAWQVPSALIGGMAEQLTLGTVASLTVKVVEQVALLPAASVAVTVIECAPRPTRVPAEIGRASCREREARQGWRRVVQVKR